MTRRATFISIGIGALLLSACASDDEDERWGTAASRLPWVEQAVLVPAGAQPGDSFGGRVALSGDIAVLVGASAYVFEMVGTQWTEQHSVSPAEFSASSFRAAAVSGDTALLTVYQGAPDPSGRVVVLARGGGVWSVQQILAPSDGPNTGFGVSLAISGDTAVVGAPVSPPATGPDAAYVYVRNGPAWTEQQKLVGADVDADGGFGRAVSISGDTILVGAHNDNGDFDHLSGTGSAVVFVRVGAVWTEQQELVASDGFFADGFGGWSVSVFGDVALVAAYCEGGIPDDGQSCCSPGMDWVQGQAYLFTRSGAVWTEQQKLRPSSEGIGDCFSVNGTALTADRAFVGASSYGPSTHSGALGRVYSWQQGPGGLSEAEQIVALDDQALTLAADGETLLVGNPYANDATGVGHVYTPGAGGAGAGGAGSVGGSSTGGTDPGTAGSAGTPRQRPPDEGCGCRAVGNQGPLRSGWSWALFAATLLVGASRRRWRSAF